MPLYPSPNPAPPPPRPANPPSLALFGTSLAWAFLSQIIAAKASRGLSLRYLGPSFEPLLGSVFFLFLLFVGFSFLHNLTSERASLRELLALPKRPTTREEWSIGAAIGWAAVILAVLPMMLAGTLTVHLWTAPRAFTLLLINLAALAIGALAEETAFRGYPFRRLIDAVGPTAATIIMAVLFGLAHGLNPSATWTSVFTTMLAGVLLSLAWLRTHGLWLPWGLHFAWNASMGILFGLPVSGLTSFAGPIETSTFGPRWLTGGTYGPEASISAIVAILVAIVVLIRLTRDYAWNYTHPAIVPGGFPMEVPPPAAHVAMQSSAPAPPPPLVQILPTTPQSRSADDPLP